jgi:hypothetical protein
MAEDNLHTETLKRKRNGRFKPVEPRFWARVDKKGPEDCWEWTATRAGKGYGVMSVNGRAQYAHRISLFLDGRLDLDSPLCALHRCDNPPCVNPAHLFAGTLSDNQQDAMAKGRMMFQTRPECYLRGENHPAHRWSAEARERIFQSHRGERNRHAKLTEEDIVQIFKLRSTGMYLQDIADRFSVSRSNVCIILKRKAWRHLTGLDGVEK